MLHIVYKAVLTDCVARLSQWMAVRLLMFSFLMTQQLVKTLAFFTKGGDDLCINLESYFDHLLAII